MKKSCFLITSKLLSPTVSKHVDMVGNGIVEKKFIICNALCKSKVTLSFSQLKEGYELEPGCYGKIQG